MFARMAINPYDNSAVEEKWQKAWSEAIESADAEQTPVDSAGSLVLQWPFPVGGLTWTELRCLVLADVYSRFRRIKGQDVRIGRTVDGFHEEALEEALQQGKSPTELIGEKIDRLESVEKDLAIQANSHAGPGAGIGSTSAPAYYRFTQWLFLELLRSRHIQSVRVAGKAAAAEESAEAEPVIEDEFFQWSLDLVPFAEKLHSDIDKSQWPEMLRKEQRALIGRRRGTELQLAFSQSFRNEYLQLPVFTTRLEALYGLTFILVAPGHEIIDFVTDPDYLEEVESYQARYENGQESYISGVRTGGFALNPINLEKVPVLVSPLALGLYSDGVVLGIPAHDRKQFEFAKRVKLRIREVVHSNSASFDHEGRLTEAYEGTGKLTNSSSCSGMSPVRARERIIKLLSRRDICSKKTRYSLRSLPVSGMSAWGTPVPLHHGAVGAEEGAEVSGVDEDKLPLHGPQLELGSIEPGDHPVLLPWLGRAWSYLQAALPGLDGVVDGFREDFENPCVEPDLADEAGDSEPGAGVSDIPAASQQAPPPAEPSEPAEGEIVELVEAPDNDSESVPQEQKPASTDEEGEPIPESESDGEPLREESQTAAAAGEATESAGDSDDDPGEDGAPVLEGEAVSEQGEEDAEEESAAGESDPSGQESPNDEDASEPPQQRPRPFFSDGLEGLLPVDVVFAGTRLSPKEIVGLRCITKFLYKKQYIPSFEPFRRFCQVGTLSFAPKDQPEGGGDETLASSYGDLLGRFGVDALRLQLLEAPAGNSASFDADSLYRTRRFLEKIWRSVSGRIGKGRFVSRNVLVAKHRLIYDVSRRLQELKFHTAVSAIREFVNFLTAEATLEEVDKSTLETFLVVLKPFAPHLACELWELLDNAETIDDTPWPEYSKELVEPAEREHAVFVNGELIDRLTESMELDAKKLESKALSLDSVREFIGRRKVGRVEVVPGRLIWICLGKKKPAGDNAAKAGKGGGDKRASGKTAAATSNPQQDSPPGSEKTDTP